MKDLRWRVLVVVAIVAVALLCLLPTLSKELPRWWTNVFPSEKIHLGLDLQGGMHLLLEVQTDKAVENTVERLAQEMKDDFREAQIRFRQVERQGEDQILVILASGQAWEPVN
ncbi:MAG: protein translocase subunit SecD, partial [Nitrospirota bacterium]